VKARILCEWSLGLQKKVMIGVEVKLRLEINKIDARIEELFRVSEPTQIIAEVRAFTRATLSHPIVTV
jgi:hypothetical protein